MCRTIRQLTLASPRRDISNPSRAAADVDVPVEEGLEVDVPDPTAPLDGPACHSTILPSGKVGCWRLSISMTADRRKVVNFRRVLSRRAFPLYIYERNLMSG